MDRRSFLQSLSALGAFVFAGGKPAKPSKLTMPFKSWGYEPGGQLDNAVASTNFAGPATTVNSGWTALAGGTNWWLGLKGGVPYQFGQNDRGQRGDGTTNSTASVDK